MRRSGGRESGGGNALNLGTPMILSFNGLQIVRTGGSWKFPNRIFLIGVIYRVKNVVGFLSVTSHMPGTNYSEPDEKF